MTTEVGVSMLVFGGVAIGVYALMTLVDPYWLRVRNRVHQLETTNDPLATGAKERPATESRLRFLGELQRLNPYHATARQQLQQRLAKAGAYDAGAVSRYFAAKVLLLILPVAAALGAGALGYMQMDLAVFAACLVGCFGFMAPGVWLAKAIARQHLLLQKSLPDLLDLMTVCLEGGLSLQETIRRVGDELLLAHPALAAELTIVQRDVELGATVEQALKRFAVRSDCEGVRTLSTFMRETQRFGTNITEALRGHADMLRSQREQMAEENAQKAAVKILLPTLFLIFPAIFVVVVGPAAIQIWEAFTAR
jgi:tight adherence protein C